MDQYNLFAFKVPLHEDFFDQFSNSNISYTTSKFRNSPLTSLGSHWYHDRVRDKMKPFELNKLTQGRKKQMYRVTNPFEHNIDDHTEDIHTITKQYLNLKDEQILSRAFYKLWEIMMGFDLINQKKPLSVITLAEAPGSFLQTVIHYRKKIVNQTKDTFECITIHGEDLEEDVPRMHKTFIDKYKKILTIHPTCCLNESKTSKMDNGDLTDIKTITNFHARVDKKKAYADIITADGGFNWDEEKYQEAEAYTLLLGEIITALKVQNKGGHFVLKIFSTFTPLTVKLVLLLTSFYKDVIVTKPLMSRMSNSERYIVCKHFKTAPNDKKTQVKTNQLVTLLTSIKKDEARGHFVSNIAPKYEIPTPIGKLFRCTSMRQSNLQMMQINTMMQYLRDGDFYGDQYNQFRNKQIGANKAWVDHFYPPDKQIKKALEACENSMTTTMDHQDKQAQQFPYMVA